jgi:CBS domain containing-hemolysin-like protein
MRLRRRTIALFLMQLMLAAVVCVAAVGQSADPAQANPLPWPVLILILALSIMLSFLFSGYETGFVQCNPIRIEYLAVEEKNPRAIRLLQHRHNPNKLITTLLIGNNLVLILGSMSLTDLTRNDFAATLLALPLFLIFGETVPKSIFRAHPNRLSLTFLPFVRVAYVVLSPLVVPVNVITRALIHVVGGPTNPLRPTMSSVEEMRVLVDESVHQGSLDPEEQQMIHSVIDLQNKQAKEIMVPRIDVEALPTTATRDELLALFEETGRTRILVYRESIDQIVGVTNAYDVLLDQTPQHQDIARFIHDVLHVPDTMRVDDLLAMLKREKHHLAVVVDEYGGTDGIVTIEDILEEIFGDIQDEHDTETSLIHQVGPNAFVMDGRTYLEDASEAIGIPLLSEEVETVGGWVMHVAGKIPAIGEVFYEHGIRVTILDATVNAILRVRLERTEEPDPHAGPPGEKA